MVKVVIDKKKCIGCGSCANICPDDFKMKENKSCVKNSKIKNIESVKKAKAICPTNAIQIKE